MYQYQAISCILAIVGSNTIKRDIGIKNRIDPADESINIKIITVRTPFINELFNNKIYNVLQTQIGHIQTEKSNKESY